MTTNDPIKADAPQNVGDAYRPAPPMNRAANLCCRLGLTVGVAIALAGCNHSPTWLGDDWPSATKEADVTCYSLAKDYVGHADVRAALADGILTEKECHEVIMPYVDADNLRARDELRNEAISAASAGDARSDETGNTDSARQGEHATAKPGRPNHTVDTTEAP